MSFVILASLTNITLFIVIWHLVSGSLAGDVYVCND